jgi:copper chaperone NosL
MSKLSRILAALGALALLATFAFPLWRFQFEAPQYPEGLAMSISTNRLAGDLGQINGLNHYVGMRAIHPDSFWELRYFPWIIGALCVWGLATAIVGKRAFLLSWVVALVLAGLLGLYDFWHWLYSFGHALDPHAPITMDPFTPPVIGEEHLMNFDIHAWPMLGGIAIMVAVALAFIALLTASISGRRHATVG